MRWPIGSVSCKWVGCWKSALQRTCTATPPRASWRDLLGAANLFLGEVSQRGLHLGAATQAQDTMTPRAATGAEGGAGGSPKTSRFSLNDQSLTSRPFASGIVRALTFAGHQQHVNIQLAERSGVKPAIGNGHDPSAAMTVDALRSAAEQSAAPLQIGASVSLGVRRMHALPTPISSFHLMAADALRSDALASNPLLAQLVRSMQARVIRHDDRRRMTKGWSRAFA